ncbi:hypothetical protein [Nonomuraea sp. NPDC049129]|uniref:hypothetical protein n=1 Tax=Nonomuraea sp. NPDC049129 TaxID=3155272 RepID=UPI0033F943A7
MDSHGSVPPTRPPARPGVDAPSRSADGEVTRRRQTDHGLSSAHPDLLESEHQNALNDHTTQCVAYGEIVSGMRTANGKVYLSEQADPRVDRVACPRAEPPRRRHLPQVEQAAL